MTNLVDEAKGSGEANARARKWRFLGLSVGYQIALLAIIALLALFLNVEMSLRGPWDPKLVAATVGLLVPAGSIYLYLFHRLLDEQEERAYLWASCMGWYFVMGAGIGWHILAQAHLVAPFNFVGLCGASAGIHLLTWFWLKFR